LLKTTVVSCTIY